jgi:hypothetical protein
MSNNEEEKNSEITKETTPPVDTPNVTIDDAGRIKGGELADTELDSVSGGGTPIRNLRG